MNHGIQPMEKQCWPKYLYWDGELCVWHLTSLPAEAERDEWSICFGVQPCMVPATFSRLEKPLELYLVFSLSGWCMHVLAWGFPWFPQWGSPLAEELQWACPLRDAAPSLRNSRPSSILSQQAWVRLQRPTSPQTCLLCCCSGSLTWLSGLPFRPPPSPGNAAPCMFHKRLFIVLLFSVANETGLKWTLKETIINEKTMFKKLATG
jgi:hypothetical protein